jgi:hypothetical protein
LELFLAGETLTPDFKEHFYKEAEAYGITKSQIVFHEDATNTPEDLSETEIIKGIYEYNEKQINRLNDSINKLESIIADYKNKEIPVGAISKELFAQYPNITDLSLTRGSTVNAAHGHPSEQIVAFLTSNEPMDAEQHDRIERWLKVRLENENVMVVIQQTE